MTIRKRRAMLTHSKTSMIDSSQQDAHQFRSFVKSCWEAQNNIMGAQASSLLAKIPKQLPIIPTVLALAISISSTRPGQCEEASKQVSKAPPAAAKAQESTKSSNASKSAKPTPNSVKTSALTQRQSTTANKLSTAASQKSPPAKATGAQNTPATKSTKRPATQSTKPPLKSTIKRPVRRITRPPIPAIPAVVNAQGKPIWLNVDEGLKAGKALKKYVVADFYTDWCGWCKVLDKTTFHDPAVEAFLAKNAVCMKVNSEDNKRGSSLSEEFEVSGWPTVIIFDPAGHEVDRNAGFMPAPQFLDWARKTIAQKK